MGGERTGALGIELEWEMGRRWVPTLHKQTVKVRRAKAEKRIFRVNPLLVLLSPLDQSLLPVRTIASCPTACSGAV